MDFFQHQAFIVARTPRISYDRCGVRLVDVPWARPNSGFTLLIEGLILEMARSMPVRKVANTRCLPPVRALWARTAATPLR